MSELLTKVDIVKVATGNIEGKIAFIRESMLEAQQIANDYGQPKDRYDAFRNQQIRYKGQLSQQMENLTADLLNLKKIDLTIKHESVSLGSLVHTSLQKVFISISMGKILVKGEDYFLISSSVPFYQAIQSKKAGDKVSFNNKIIEILEVY